MSNLESMRPISAAKRKGSMKDVREYEAKLRKQAKRERRAETKKRIRDELTPALRRAVWSRFGTLCYLCGQTGADTIDHIIPLIKGGTNDISNLRPTHELCNKRKGNKIWILPEELESAGW